MSTELPRGLAAEDSGFTMLEVMVTTSIVSVLAAIGTFGFSNWQKTSEHQGSADAVLSQLRNAAVRATTEGRTYCVELREGGTEYSLWRYKCDTAAPASGAPAHGRVGAVQSTQDAAVTLTSSVTSLSGNTCTAGARCIYFTPRGTASPATVTVASTERPAKTYQIRIEGLTARVYF